ncbi:MAG TPA: TetR/AcrR family transcriptional regulator [Acidimicrobiales bacterium]|nr:TetR/AcrR family transcriptional regulator [Acidimicrobiales bacterium]
MRGQILDAARALLAETEDESAVSIRAVAERVGVTTPSIYRHFKDKEALMDAVCSEVFGALAVALERAAEPAGSPLERLLAQGRAYVQFALANPEQYRMVFLGNDEPKNVDEVLTERCFTQVLQAVGECMSAGIFPPDPDGPLPISMQLWASAHGLASLMLCKPWLPWGDVGTTIERALAQAVAGCAVAGSPARLAPGAFEARLRELNS